MSTPRPGPLEATAAEIESHVAAAGWDQRPALFALVAAARFATDDPETARRLGIDAARHAVGGVHAFRRAAGVVHGKRAVRAGRVGGGDGVDAFALEEQWQVRDLVPCADVTGEVQRGHRPVRQRLGGGSQAGTHQGGEDQGTNHGFTP